MSILTTIVEQRRVDVADAKAACPLNELLRTLESDQAFPQIDFAARIAPTERVHVLAEVKRASPSKGDIALGIVAGQQGLLYAKAGASTISCLTEPKWFKGTLNDMRDIRVAIEGLPNRPALLRKDFIIDEYQVYEARAYGADTLLLIVACLTDDELKHLLSVSRSLKMEPLVEVANDEEMARALAAGSKIIGINNRNLHTFNVDITTTTKLVQNEAYDLSGVIMIALSGINTRADVQNFETIGVKSVLVGEALMRSPNPINKIRELQGLSPIPLVKICGIKDVQMAIDVVDAGADFIGLVFAESIRKVTIEEATAITVAIKGRRLKQEIQIEKVETGLSQNDWYTKQADALSSVVSSTRPLVVGVFANNDPKWVEEVATTVGLDIIQLSGLEGLDAGGHKFSVPVWKAVHVKTGDDPNVILKDLGAGVNAVASILLDTKVGSSMGGSGQTFDWSIAKTITQSHPIILAGGLSPVNVGDAVTQVHPFAIDISSGVESSPGVKDLDKIKLFINNAKQIL